MRFLDNIKISSKIVLPIVVIGIIGGLSMYLYFVNEYKQAKIDAIVGKARAVVLSAESAREFAADQSKNQVFKTDLTDLKKVLYTVPIFSAMEVAKKKSKELGFTIKIPKIQPRNPDNQPDEYEKKVLKSFESNKLKEFW